MSVDKLVDSTQLDADLTSVANAIRTKGGTSGQLAFPSGFVSAIGNISTGLDIKKLTATVSADTTGTITLLTDPQLQKALNDPKGFVMMRYMGVGASTAELMFWFAANFIIGYSGTTAYNCLLIRATASSINANYNTHGLAGDNYNGHINITSSGGLLLMNNVTYPLKAGNYEILAGIWE